MVAERKTYKQMLFMEPMTWEVVSSLTTAIATVLLALLTAFYIRELRRQDSEREYTNLCDTIYIPILKNLQEIVQIPNEFHGVNLRPAFVLKDLKTKFPHLMYRLPREFFEHIQSFSKEYELYQNSFPPVWKEIQELIRKEILHRYKISDRSRVIHVSIMPVSSVTDLLKRDIESFILERVDPAEWVRNAEREYLFPIVWQMKSSHPIEKTVNIESDLEDLSSFYESLVSKIEQEESLKMLLDKQGQLFEDAEYIMEQIQSFLSANN